MSTRRSAIATGVPFGIDVANADCVTRGQADGRDTSGCAQARARIQKALRRMDERSWLREEDIRLEERCRERARIAHELHDRLLQGFLAASMLLGQAVEQVPVDSTSMPALSRALRLVRQAIDEGRAA